MAQKLKARLGAKVQRLLEAALPDLKEIMRTSQAETVERKVGDGAVVETRVSDEAGLPLITVGTSIIPLQKGDLPSRYLDGLRDHFLESCERLGHPGAPKAVLCLLETVENSIRFSQPKRKGSTRHVTSSWVLTPDAVVLTVEDEGGFKGDLAEHLKSQVAAQKAKPAAQLVADALAKTEAEGTPGYGSLLVLHYCDDLTSRQTARGQILTLTLNKALKKAPGE